MPLSRARFMFRFGLALLGLGAAAIAFTVLRGPADLPTSGELTVFVAGIVAGTGILVAWVGWRTLSLASDNNIIAQWIVTSEEWQRYAAACTMRVAMPGALPGAVPLDLPVGAAGIEVSALTRGFRVGESFHELGGLSAEVLDMRVVDSPADMFEFNVIYATGRTSSVRLGVRIPIATYAKRLANEVEDYWVKKEPLQSLSVEQLRARARSGWTLAIVGLLAFLGTITLFIFINPPGWAAIFTVGSLGIAMYGFGRGVKARNVVWRKGG